MLRTLKESFKNILPHKDIKKLRSLLHNISYPPFFYSQFAHKLVFIFGCQRSGTTLSYLMLNCHPLIQGIDETDSCYKLPRPVQLFSLSKQYSLLLLKLPNQTFNLEYFVHNLQGIKILWSVRNPYAVISSMLRWKLKNVSWIKVHAQAELWQHSFLFPEILELDLANLDEVSLGAYIWKYKERTLQLYQQSNLDIFSYKYEELLDDPRLIMSNVLDFMELGWNDNVLCHEQYYQFDRIYPGGTQQKKPLDKSRKQPKLLLSTEEIDLITNICSEEMQPYQYTKPLA
ncbi:conserved hypothetical protein [Hyella patelloides LEGE 07179]|uniref:Sulfotransferase domain-containing protein n=1 Tax=Hyella patelloides LEGE 07179 TaxID=945734 RepID=A0A563VZP4_9CYAN|nr:sulfotransferase [Hyella patelloides]VEP16865.1 conserved hypothetical protein [Hyella patelloides LEGE 07179]